MDGGFTMSDPLAPSFKRSARPNRRGQSIVLVGVMLAGLLGIMALAIDIGYLLQVRSRLQGMADASALAAAQELPSETGAKAKAIEYATQNDADHGTIVAAGEVVVGNWDGLGVFDPGGLPTNAVRVVARRTSERNNSVALFFAKALGITATNVSAWATATAGGGNAGGEIEDNQFIIDAEMIDTDIPSIEDLARSLGKTTEELINDGPDADWFIDLPPGSVLDVPTGQVGDEGIFDIDTDAFQFMDPGAATPGDGYCAPPSTPPPLNVCTYHDFLNYNEDSSSWRYGLFDKKMLDPLLGVRVVSDINHYPYNLTPSQLPTPCFVSPVYKGDVNRLNDVKGVPAVNALGWRRGLLAFRINSVGPDPSGSVLPNLVIEVCDPAPYLDPANPQLTQLPYEVDLPLRLVQ